MHIAIATTATPLVTGGAEYLCDNLKTACESAGHAVSVITKPFSDASPTLVKKSIAQWQVEDFSLYGRSQPDLVIGLKFPAFYLEHDCQVNWLLHQHRAVYDLWDWLTKQGHDHSDEELALREQIQTLDTQALSSALQNFTISKNVSKRLLHYNGISAPAIYHPPALADQLKPRVLDLGGDYIFAPSRLEPLKRQSLLIEALSMTRQPVKAVICGGGSQRPYLQALIDQHQLQHRVRLLPHVSDKELVKLYRGAAAVFFTPYDEDYGYITLEAMAAAKPVVTCFDSGGPTEFVLDGETGNIEPPEALYLARRLDQMHADKKTTRAMGDQAYQHYCALDLNWQHVVEQLVS